MTIDGIEAHFDEDEGHLRLDCSDGDFIRIRDSLINEVSVADQLTPFAEGIRSIVIRPLSALRAATPDRFGQGFRIVLLAVALSLSAATQVIGLVAIARWLWSRGS